MELEEMKEYRIDFAGEPIIFEFGKMARLADGAVTVRYGNTVILVTACVSDEPREGVDFLPLRVDFEERQYAIGRIPGSFFRREGKPTDNAILSARLIDRTFRPLFPEGYRRDLQVIVTVLSYDPDYEADICGIIGASLALGVSPIPARDLLAGVKVGYVDGRIVLNPSDEQMSNSSLDLIVAGTEDAITMVEATGEEVGEDIILDGIIQAQDEIKKLVRKQREIVDEIGKPKEEFAAETVEEELSRAVREMATGDIRKVMSIGDKEDRRSARSRVREDTRTALEERFPDEVEAIDSVLDEIEKEQMRDRILSEGIRADGRKVDEIRPIHCEVSLLGRVHGSGLFTRGETQVLTVAALGSVGDRQLLDSLDHVEELKRYLHHYNFPPYSTGETRPLFAPSRREVGHGNLAERALVPVLPNEQEFPYTLRLVSEVLASNGSSSMASVCASSLALMDAGVHISAPVAGIALGLIKHGDDVVVLSDILGLEDHLGDMDLKTAGTQRGITAIQMDIKIKGVDRGIMQTALERAKRDRQFILSRMKETIAEPREELSRFAPRIMTMQVDPSKIRHIIGPGGKTINSIISDFGVDIDVEDDGTVYIASEDGESAIGAQDRILELTADAEVGKIYKGKVKRVVDKLGAFVEILPNKEGLVHISKLETGFVDEVTSVASVGDEIMVKLVEVDDLGRLNFSRKAVINEMGRERVEAQESRSTKSSSKTDTKPAGGNRGRRR